MVNASLNWASIVGIVLAVGGALLYFMRSFKPALARDYDVFFAAVGLLCGGILFFQGWRLDPILQFGQFLLAGTTVFFAYESVRLRGVTTEQARRSSYFDDDEPPGPPRPQMGGRSWNDDADRFAEPEPIRRRIRSREEDSEDGDDFYRPSRPSRAAIPERAASRREPPENENWDSQPAPAARRYSAGPSAPAADDFGARRRERDTRPDTRRGSRPAPSGEDLPRSSRRGPLEPAAGVGLGGPSGPGGGISPAPGSGAGPGVVPGAAAYGQPKGEPIRPGRAAASAVSDADFRPVPPSSRGSLTGSESSVRSGGQAQTASPAARATSPGPSPAAKARDNSSRFDD